MVCHHCYFVKSCGCHVEEDPINIQSKCHKREASRGEDAGGQWWQQWHGTAGVGQHDEQPRPPVPERCSGSIQWRNVFGNAILWSRSCVDCHRILSFIHSCSMSLYMNSCKKKSYDLKGFLFWGHGIQFQPFGIYMVKQPDILASTPSTTPVLPSASSSWWASRWGHLNCDVRSNATESH